MVYGRLRVTLQRVTSHGDCVLRKMEVVEDKPKSKMASHHPDAANKLASAGAAPFLSCPITHRPPDKGPKELLQQAHSSHVQVREQCACIVCANVLMSVHLLSPIAMVLDVQEHSCVSTLSWSV